MSVRVVEVAPAVAPGRLGVVGWPVAHSRSPAMQTAAFKALGLRGWSYQRLPVPPELFAETVSALADSGFVGVNVTVPHKEAALALADAATARAIAIGAANTLSFMSDGAITADNTDAPGLIDALAVDVSGRNALVLGAGGSARAAIWALREHGARVSVWNRTAERARLLADEFAVMAVERPLDTEILVNCTTVGLDAILPDIDFSLRSLHLDADLLSRCTCVADLVYRDRPTGLISAARAAGIPTVDGRDVLLAQGALSFQSWTGLEAPREAMARAITDG